jgi:peptidyl-prolyl cis-trans isomerase C
MRSRVRLAFLSIVLTLTTCPITAQEASVAAGKEAESAVVLASGKYQVTAEDIDRYILENVPSDKREAVLAKPGIYREMAENIYLVRLLADEAIKDPEMDPVQAEWAARMRHQRRLTSEYRIVYLQRALEDVNWESNAKEVYLAEPERFMEPEKVSVSHILVSLQGRSDEEALALASELRERALAGEDFAGLAEEYSDDPSVASNKGGMGYFPRGAMVKPFEDEAFSMQKVGAISEPVKTKFGYHVIRFDGRKAAVKKPFEQVEDEIIAELQKNLANKIWQDKIIAARSAPGIKINEEELSELAAKYGAKAGSD